MRRRAGLWAAALAALLPASVPGAGLGLLGQGHLPADEPAALPGSSPTDAADLPPASDLLAALDVLARPPVRDPRRGPLSAGGSSHTVAPGESLWTIAAARCGAGTRWREIFEANRAALPNPNHIRPGLELEVPCAEAPGDGGSDAPSGDPDTPAAAPPPLPDRRPDPPPSPSPGGGFVTHRPLPAGSHRTYANFHKRRVKPNGRVYYHKGVDLPAPTGTPIAAVADGVVREARWMGGYGWVVFVDHPGGFQTRYAHMARRPDVRPGQRVRGGERLGVVGSTGRSTGPHLHLEVRKDGRPVNPLDHCDL